MRRGIKYSLTAIFFIYIEVICYPQSDSLNHSFNGIQAGYGFVIPYSSAVDAVSHLNSAGLSVAHGKMHTSYDSWKIFNAYWSSGFQFRFVNFQYPEVIGNNYDLTLFAEPVIWHGRKNQLSARLGLGIAYMTKTYDETTNPTNQFVSTRISFTEYLNLRFSHRIGERTSLVLSGCFNHISNGGIKQPNNGLTYAGFAVGVDFYKNPIPSLANIYKRELKIEKPGIYATLQYLSGIRVFDETEFFPEITTFTFGFNFRMAKQITPSYSLNAGAEFINDGYIREIVRRESLDMDHKRIALTVGQEFLFGNVFLSQSFGYYVYSPFPPRNAIYEKYELSYRIHKRVLAGIFLKANGKDSELIGLTISALLFKN